MAYADSILASGFQDYSLMSAQRTAADALRRLSSGELQLFKPTYATNSRQREETLVEPEVEIQRTTLQSLIEKEMDELMLN